MPAVFLAVTCSFRMGLDDRVARKPLGLGRSGRNDEGKARTGCQEAEHRGGAGHRMVPSTVIRSQPG